MKRINIWRKYYEAFENMEGMGVIKRPKIPEYSSNNAHMFYVLFENINERTKFIEYMKSRGIQAVFHYVPLHSSPAGLRFGRVSGEMSVTDNISERLVRIPIFYDLTDKDLDYIVRVITEYGI